MSLIKYTGYRRHTQWVIHLQENKKYFVRIHPSLIVLLFFKRKNSKSSYLTRNVEKYLKSWSKSNLLNWMRLDKFSFYEKRAKVEFEKKIFFFDIVTNYHFLHWYDPYDLGVTWHVQGGREAFEVLETALRVARDNST